MTSIKSLSLTILLGSLSLAAQAGNGGHGVPFPKPSRGAVDTRDLEAIDTGLQLCFNKDVKYKYSEFYTVDGELIMDPTKYKPKVGAKVCAFNLFDGKAGTFEKGRTIKFVELEMTEFDFVYRTLKEPEDKNIASDPVVAAVNCFEVTKIGPGGLERKSFKMPAELQSTLGSAISAVVN
ncbi:MAG TPA: hypothetical protein VM901_11820 [Bdellovibrionota bacterium]|nr:hypothetical protein [Bdellovibrionota bacterium]